MMLPSAVKLTVLNVIEGNLKKKHSIISSKFQNNDTDNSYMSVYNKRIKILNYFSRQVTRFSKNCVQNQIRVVQRIYATFLHNSS